MLETNVPKKGFAVEKMIELSALKEQLRLLGHDNLPDDQIVNILREMNVDFQFEGSDDEGPDDDIAANYEGLRGHAGFNSINEKFAQSALTDQYTHIPECHKNDLPLQYAPIDEHERPESSDTSVRGQDHCKMPQDRLDSVNLRQDFGDRDAFSDRKHSHEWYGVVQPSVSPRPGCLDHIDLNKPPTATDCAALTIPRTQLSSHHRLDQCRLTQGHELGSDVAALPAASKKQVSFKNSMLRANNGQTVQRSVLWEEDEDDADIQPDEDTGTVPDVGLDKKASSYQNKITQSYTQVPSNYTVFKTRGLSSHEDEEADEDVYYHHRRGAGQDMYRDHSTYSDKVPVAFSKKSSLVSKGVGRTASHPASLSHSGGPLSSHAPMSHLHAHEIVHVARQGYPLGPEHKAALRAAAVAASGSDCPAGATKYKWHEHLRSTSPTASSVISLPRSLAPEASSRSSAGGRRSGLKPGAVKKVDRVQRYQQLQQGWSKDKFLRSSQTAATSGPRQPGPANRKPSNFHTYFAVMHAVEAAEKERMLKQARNKTTSKLQPGLEYVAPTSKRRDALRWETRLRMQSSY
ncbi:hypothetical protein CEUSTIGMA_g13031.t1 [Chlamydomonas eustigma]|uniref:Uncharacterized protein n=1 Tax=Chlamydomonas eustigma TaxID=1157962 RepID=A0A250XRE5_9CHLO|nr:hypothetical protein CEUSTIGMA_g13031.t1 [Chlamydomonas eustigma]|eukprot:GAX85616.1 hypothetical protein CEUSTIGMA_g13031.t1 [Chlamydomonas eustigma]